MKTIIISLFISFQLLAQNPLLTPMDGGYSTEATLYFSASGSLSGIQKTRIDTFIGMLKDSLAITSLSSYFDCIWLLANETSTAALKNLVKRDHDCTLNNTPTFTQWQGYAGNGSNASLLTDYNASTDGNNYTQNNAGFGVYIRNDVTETKVDMGYDDGTRSMSLISKYLGGTGIQINDRTNTVPDSTSASTGLFIVDRSGANNKTVFRNSWTLSAVTNVASVGLPNGVVQILNRGGASLYTTHQIAFAFISKSVSATEARKINNCVEWYMDQLGTGVQ